MPCRWVTGTPEDHQHKQRGHTTSAVQTYTDRDSGAYFWDPSRSWATCRRRWVSWCGCAEGLRRRLAGGRPLLGEPRGTTCRRQTRGMPREWLRAGYRLGGSPGGIQGGAREGGFLHLTLNYVLRNACAGSPPPHHRSTSPISYHFTLSVSQDKSPGITRSV